MTTQLIMWVMDTDFQKDKLGSNNTTIRLYVFVGAELAARVKPEPVVAQNSFHAYVFTFPPPTDETVPAPKWSLSMVRKQVKNLSSPVSQVHTCAASQQLWKSALCSGYIGWYKVRSHLGEWWGSLCVGPCLAVFRLQANLIPIIFLLSSDLSGLHSI